VRDVIKGRLYFPLMRMMNWNFALWLVLAAASAAGAQTLLVANQGDSTTSLIDAKTGGLLAAVPDNTPGVHGHEVAASADGRFAFVPIYGSTGVGKPGIDGHEMLIIDIAARKVVGHVDFGHAVRPHMPLLDPVSGMLYVTTELDSSISIIDPKTWKIVGAIPTGAKESHMLALSHDGSRGYTANVGPGTVSVLDMKARKTLGIIPVASSVQRISISADDKLVFTSDVAKPQLAVIDTATQKVKIWVALPSQGYGTAVTPDGRWLLVCIPAKDQVAVIDLNTMKIARTVDVAKDPQEIVIRPDAKVAYVSCENSNQIAAIDLAQWKVEKLIDAGSRADGVAWAR
jgi:DNA-binding beta-propeller fold protein YncE